MQWQYEFQFVVCALSAVRRVTALDEFCVDKVPCLFPILPLTQICVHGGGGGLFYEESVVVGELGRRIGIAIKTAAMQTKLTHS